MLHALLSQADASDAATAGAVAAASLVSLIFSLVFLAIALVPVYMIAKKAGYNPFIGILVAFVPIYNLMWLYKIYQRVGQNGWMCLIQFVPFVGIIMLYVLAFSKWPVTAGPTVSFAPPTA